MIPRGPMDSALLQAYLEGNRLQLRWIMMPSSGILVSADATGKLARWGLRLSKLGFDAVQFSGTEHQDTNAFYGYQ